MEGINILTIKVPLKDANKVKTILIREENLDGNYKTLKERLFVYFPIKTSFKTKYVITNKELETLEHLPHSLKDALKTILTKDEMEKVKTAYDCIGDIAILEIDRELRKKEKVIANTLLRVRRDIKTVVRKEGSHEGTFRVQKMKYLAGENKKETIHKENNIRLMLDIEKVYFSPRLSLERMRIAELVNNSKSRKSKNKKSVNKEDILVMFSGCAPYCCVIAKNAKNKVNSIIGIEINPEGHKYGLENIKLNKLDNVCNINLINGDVKKEIPKLAKTNATFDRILMPLPKHAEDFLPEALAVSKKGTIIHFYDFLHEEKFNEAVEKIKKACEKAKKNCKILEIVKCGQHSPRTFRICVDFRVE
ncbi:class I SAM-dependent methyltransferase family protein [Candidatus Woesearchaeota archaeon]|nr:class I SAM-dependent methyltransferase family protein [Candidatus Woesearchaeota archaeon]